MTGSHHPWAPALLVLFCAALSYADDSIRDPGSLAEDLERFGISSLHTEGRAFEGRKIWDERRGLELPSAAAAYEEIRKKDEDRNRGFGEKGNYHLGLTGRGYYEDASHEKKMARLLAPDSESRMDTLAGAYQLLNNVFIGSSCKVNPDGSLPSGCQHRREQLNQFMSRPASVISADPSSMNILKDWKEESIAVLQAYHGALYAGSPDHAKGFLGSLRDQLTTEQKLDVVRLFGRRFLADYNQERLDEGIRASGSVGLGRLLYAAQFNTELGYDGSFEIPGTIFGGICRDIASGQGQMLQALGFDDVYVVGYARDDGQGHATVLARDPGNPLRVRKIDYDKLETSVNLDGSRALYQGPEDITLNYTLSYPNGATVQTIPSDMYKLLKEAAGSDIRNLDPMARASHSIAGLTGGKDLGDGQKAELRLFSGMDATRANYFGAAGAVAWGQKPPSTREFTAPGKLGLVLVTRRVQGSSVRHDLVYAEVDQKVISPVLSLDKGRLQAMLTGELIAAILVSRTQGGEGDGKFAFQPDFRIGVGAQVNQFLLEDQLRLTHRAGVQLNFLGGWLDVANNHSRMITFNHAFVSSEASLKVSESPQVQLIAAALMAVSEVSVRSRIEAGLAVEEFAATFYWEGRVDGSMPVYEDSSLRRAGFTLKFTPVPWAGGWVSGFQELEGAKDRGIMGGLEIQH